MVYKKKRRRPEEAAMQERLMEVEKPKEADMEEKLKDAEKPKEAAMVYKKIRTEESLPVAEGVGAEKAEKAEVAAAEQVDIHAQASPIKVSRTRRRLGSTSPSWREPRASLMTPP